MLVIYLALGAAALAWSTLRGQPNVWRWGGREDPEILLGTAAGLLMGLGIVFLSRLAVHRYDWGRFLHREFRARLGPLSDAECLILAGASSLGEELFFRGAMLPALGLLPSNVLFALLHIGPSARYLPWTISSFVIGVVLGQLFVWSGDLTGPVVAHFVVNFLNLRHLSRHHLR